jgi:hypothetical protein
MLTPLSRRQPQETCTDRAKISTKPRRAHGQSESESTVSSRFSASELGKRWSATRNSCTIDTLICVEKYQVEIVKADGLKPLLRLLHSSYLPLILSAAACVRNVSIHPANESPIIDSNFLTPLIELLSFDENEEVQCHAISTLRNLAASSERNKGAIVEAGAVERIKDLVLTVPLAVQSEMTACVAVLALSGKLHGRT